jgi:hypothetical protein
MTQHGRPISRGPRRPEVSAPHGVRALVALLYIAFLAGCSHLVERSNAGIRALEEVPGSVGSVSRSAKYFGWGVSAPLVVGLTPVAALAWATPWADLSQAVDLASAPAIGFGYLFEAAAGFPAKGVRSLGRASSNPREASASLPWAPWGFVAERLGAERPSRPADTLPRDVEQYYAVPEAAVAELKEEVARRRRGAQPEESLVRVPLPASSFPAALELYRALGVSSRGPRPLVLMTPPTKATFAARYLARRFARRGLHAAVIAPENEFLEIHLTPREVETRFHHVVVAARTALRVLADLPEVDAGQLHYVGVSAGGIFGGVLLAVEPSIRRAVLVLPGSDLPRILRESEASSVVAYREAWKSRGVDVHALALEFARDLRTDPQRLARFVEPERVLIFLGASDTIVPVATGLALREAMGGPETYLLSGNHDTAALCFGFILRRSERFILHGR